MPIPAGALILSGTIKGCTSEAAFLEAAADHSIEYKDFGDLREKLKAIS